MSTCIIKGVIKEEANKQHSKPPYIKQTIFSHVTKQLTFEEQANQRCTHVYTSSSTWKRLTTILAGFTNLPSQFQMVLLKMSLC